MASIACPITSLAFASSNLTILIFVKSCVRGLECLFIGKFFDYLDSLTDTSVMKKIEQKAYWSATVFLLGSVILSCGRSGFVPLEEDQEKLDDTEIETNVGECPTGITIEQCLWDEKLSNQCYDTCLQFITDNECLDVVSVDVCATQLSKCIERTNTSHPNKSWIQAYCCSSCLKEVIQRYLAGWITIGTVVAKFYDRLIYLPTT